MVSEKDTLSVREQCELLSLCRQGLYYEPRDYAQDHLNILHRMDELYTEIPTYGYRRQREQLIQEGFKISPETVRKYMRPKFCKQIT